MDAATNVLLTTLKRGASVCAVFRIKRAAVHRAKESDSKGEVMETYRSVETAKERELEMQAKTIPCFDHP